LIFKAFKFRNLY